VFRRQRSKTENQVIAFNENNGAVICKKNWEISKIICDMTMKFGINDTDGHCFV